MFYESSMCPLVVVIEIGVSDNILKANVVTGFVCESITVLYRNRFRGRQISRNWHMLLGTWASPQPAGQDDRLTM